MTKFSLKDLTVIVAGSLFGSGLFISQMVYRERVIGFLDFTGSWDPTLLFVMFGAVLVTGVTFRYVLKRNSPILEQTFKLPQKQVIDRPLIFGSILFGIGWGVSGYCPGPSVAALAFGVLNPILYLSGFFCGALAVKRWQRSSQ